MDPTQCPPVEPPPGQGALTGPWRLLEAQGPAGVTVCPIEPGTCWCHRVPHRARDLPVSPCAPRSVTSIPRPIGTHGHRTAAGTMLILTCPAQLQRLEGALRRSLPLTLPVYGAVMNINRGNPAGLEVVVDAWPEFGAVLARRRGEVPVDDCYRNTSAVFYRDVGAYRALLETPGCLRWDSAFHIIGLQDGVTAVSEAIAGAKGIELDISHYYTYRHPNPSTMPEPRLDPGVRVGSLTPAHVDLLNKTWPYGGNARSRQYLEELLRLFPNLCLRDGAGQPLSWALTDPFGAGTHGYTLPAHRRSGYMWTVLVLAARRAQARGFPTFGFTATGNRPMQRLQEELGHQRLPELCCYILHNPSLKQA
ncbi:glycine N-acyltransferase-like protein 3 isoform 2-T2 [Ara ararauna]